VAASSARGVPFGPAFLWRALAVFVGIAGAVGCSSNATERCHVPLEQIGCKPTLDQQVAWGLAFRAPQCPTSGPCGAHLVWRSPQPSLGGLVCVYDNSGQQLLSGTSCSDVPLACGDFCMTGGQSIDPSTECDLSTLPPTCMDADAGM
jgi:hypothetical protein